MPLGQLIGFIAALHGSHCTPIKHNMSNDPPSSTCPDTNPAQQPTHLPRIDSVTPVASTQWISLQTISYTDQSGKARKWDAATRTTKSSSASADAVLIIPLLRKAGSATIETLLVEQYRPPVDRTTIEFPAGLIDDNESPEDCALRELREETGFVGEKSRVVAPRVSPAACLSPGLSDESAHCVVVEVDLDRPENRGRPKQDLDDGEQIVVRRVELKEGLKAVLDDADGMPFLPLYLFAMGLELGLGMTGDKGMPERTEEHE